MEGKSAKRDIHWPKILWYIHLHVLGLWGLYVLFFEAKWLTVFFAVFIIAIAGLGVTVGAHRLWCHQAFEASWPIRLLLIVAHTLVGVGPVYDWVLKHRMHHKFYGTEKDLYDHSKGFLYSHLISNCMYNDEMIDKYKNEIDMRDIDSDGFVWIQKRLYWPLFIIIGLLLPINTPAEYWDETISNSVMVLGFMRLAITLNISWLVNSAMLIWGLKPGEKYPVDDNTIFILNKSYWPNYHYLLPWDWKSGEFGTYDKGCSTVFIKIFADIGHITLLKSPSTESIQEALYKLSSDKKVTINGVFNEVHKTAELEAKKTKLYFSH